MHDHGPTISSIHKEESGRNSSLPNSNKTNERQCDVLTWANQLPDEILVACKQCSNIIWEVASPYFSNADISENFVQKIAQRHLRSMQQNHLRATQPKPRRGSIWFLRSLKLLYDVRTSSLKIRRRDSVRIRLWRNPACYDKRRLNVCCSSRREQ